MTDQIELDRRQRLAAAQLLMAIDLPQPMELYGQLMVEASNVCPGIHMGELRMGRAVGLMQARTLIEQMLAELERTGGIEPP